MFCPSCAKQIPEQSRFCLGCGKTIHVVAGSMGPEHVSSPAQRSMPGRTRNALIILIGLVGLVLLAVFNEGTRTAAAGPSAASHLFRTSVPKTEPLASGQFLVRAGGIWYKTITVDTTRMSNVRVTGRFTASGGFGNDIAAILTTQDDFENWKNGHPAQALYATGKTTVGNINVTITTPGTYYLAFSNTFSAFTEKTVSAEIDLHYTVEE